MGTDRPLAAAWNAAGLTACLLAVALMTATGHPVLGGLFAVLAVLNAARLVRNVFYR